MKNDLEDYLIDYSLLDYISKENINEHKIVPICKHEIYLLIASCKEQVDIKKLCELYDFPVKLVKITKESFEFFYKDIEIKKSMYKHSIQSIKLISRFKTDESKITLFCDDLFYLAIKMNVSDIHIECLEDTLLIRFRINGVLLDMFRYSLQMFSILSSVLKLFSLLDISQNRLPQNGRFTRSINKKDYDFRISTIPSNSGESIVLRILDNQKALIKLKQIGFSDELYKVIKKCINSLQGLILVTGPTGSGKTTTMYSMLNSMDKKHKKIITVEDPIEYKIDDITQINIHNEIGLNYNVVLKNILRQDPDILMIGEIRDKEALDIAMQAALTGHLVIATLHTNDAIKTLNRLFDMKAKPYLVASVLKLVISQRLYRVLCDDCKIETSTNNIFKEKGCSVCDFSGYIKRDVITQYLEVTQENEKFIENEKDIAKLREFTNIRSINDDLYKKVLSGKTSLNEYHKNEI